MAGLRCVCVALVFLEMVILTPAPPPSSPPSLHPSPHPRPALPGANALHHQHRHRVRRQPAPVAGRAPVPAPSPAALRPHALRGHRPLGGGAVRPGSLRRPGGRQGDGHPERRRRVLRVPEEPLGRAGAGGPRGGPEPGGGGPGAPRPEGGPPQEAVRRGGGRGGGVGAQRRFRRRPRLRRHLLKRRDGRVPRLRTS